MSVMQRSRTRSTPFWMGGLHSPFSMGGKIMADYDLDKIEKAAKAATPGEWMIHWGAGDGYVGQIEPNITRWNGVSKPASDHGRNNAIHIVATQPRAILSLISDHRAALAEVERLRGLLSEAGKVVEWFESWGCPNCGGDCASANPPISLCIMRAASDLSTRIKEEIGND